MIFGKKVIRVSLIYIPQILCLIHSNFKNSCLHVIDMIEIISVYVLFLIMSFLNAFIIYIINFLNRNENHTAPVAVCIFCFDSPMNSWDLKFQEYPMMQE